MQKFAIFLTFTFLIFSSAVHAKMVSGKVKSVDHSTRKVSIATFDPVSGHDQTLDVWLESFAAFTGVKSLEEVKPGDEVWVEAKEDSEGNLRARTMTKT